MPTENSKEYKKCLDEIIKNYKKNQDWNKVVAHKSFIPHTFCMAALVDYVEEIYGITVENSKHLEKIIMLNEKSIEKIEVFFIIGYEKGVIFDIMIADQKYTKYLRDLENAIQNGAMYKDLFNIEPMKFSMMVNKKKYPTTNQYDTIIRVIADVFHIRRENELQFYPNLRVVAKEMEMPYSAAMDIYDII